MSSVISVNSEVMSGEPVFKGTRVPVKILFEYLEGGNTIDQFLLEYDSVPKDIVVSAIREASDTLVNRDSLSASK